MTDERPYSPSRVPRRTSRNFLTQIAFEIHDTAKDKGFWDGPRTQDKYAAKMALIHSEVTELLEAMRKNKGAEAVAEEAVDILIRTLDLYARLYHDAYITESLDVVMRRKMETNAKRPALHGHKWG